MVSFFHSFLGYIKLQDVYICYYFLAYFLFRMRSVLTLKNNMKRTEDETVPQRFT